MAIKMPTAKNVEQFIAAAPDARKQPSERKGVTRGRREQITGFNTSTCGHAEKRI